MRVLRIRKVLPAAILFICAFFLYRYVRNHLSDFAAFSRISVLYAIPVCFVWLAVLAMEGLVIRALTADFDIDLGFFECLSIAVITSLGNIFLPLKGGTGFKAVYLKSRHHFDYSSFVPTLAANYLIVFNAASLMSLGCMGMLFMSTGALNTTITLVFAGVAAFTSWAMLAPAPGLGWLPFPKVREQASAMLSGWRTIGKNRKRLAQLYALALSILLLNSAATWLEFAAFHMKDAGGRGIGFLQAVTFTAIGSLSNIISLTPAALGIKEGLLMFSSHFLGITQSQALAVSLLDRSINLVVLGLSFGFASLHINRNWKKEMPRPLATVQQSSEGEPDPLAFYSDSPQEDSGP